MYAVLNDEGRVKDLNGKYPCLYTTRKLAEKDNPFNQPIVEVDEKDFDLERCAIDHCWPRGVR